MSGHYRLHRASAEIAAHFCADVGPDPWGGGSILPGSFAPVIARGGRSDKKVIRPMHWGYPPPGTSTEALGLAPPRWVAHVRNWQSPFWIGNVRHTSLRCLIPATSFLLRANNRETAYGCKSQPLFAIAGIWRDLTDMPVFAMLTTDPNAAVLPVEGGKGPSAMPVILQPADHDRWLRADWKEAQHLVAAYPSHDIVTVAED